MTKSKRHGKRKGTLGTLEAEVEDVIKKVKKLKTSKFQEMNRDRMFLTREFAKSYGRRKTPKWTPTVWSRHKRPLMLMRGYYFGFGHAVRTRVTEDKKGKKYWLDLYDGLARQVAPTHLSEQKLKRKLGGIKKRLKKLL